MLRTLDRGRILEPEGRCRPYSTTFSLVFSVFLSFCLAFVRVATCCLLFVLTGSSIWLAIVTGFLFLRRFRIHGLGSYVMCVWYSVVECTVEAYPVVECAGIVCIKLYYTIKFTKFTKLLLNVNSRLRCRVSMTSKYKSFKIKLTNF